MQQIRETMKERFDRVVIQNQMLKAGFASFPYMVLRDKGLSIGAKMAYAFLLMYAWQEGSTFAGQETIAQEMGISDRHLRRFLTELKKHGYIDIERKDRRFNNTYIILDKLPTKLKAKRASYVNKSELDRTSMSAPTGHR